MGEQPILAVQLVAETQIAKLHNTGFSACCANELNVLLKHQLQRLTQCFVESVAWLVCLAFCVAFIFLWLRFVLRQTALGYYPLLVHQCLLCLCVAHCDLKLADPANTLEQDQQHF